MLKRISLLLWMSVLLLSPCWAQQKNAAGAAPAAAGDKAKMDLFIGDLMKKMSLDDKIGQLNLVVPGDAAVTGAVMSSDVDAKVKNGQVGGFLSIAGVDKLRKIQDAAVQDTKLKIPLIFGMDVIHGHRTIFPIPLAMSCSWDMSMIEQSARLAAKEATADGINWVYSPMVDISRDPRWGRISEGSGEDPYLGSQIAKAYVQGYQGTDLSKNDTVIACVKHFALYGAVESGREYNTVDMSRLRMYQDYLPPYKAAVDAGVASVMSSFNEIDGKPASVNEWLLTDLLRKQWGFKGLLVDDYTAINECVNHGVGDLQQVSAAALKAGVDMDMVGEGYLTTLKKSFNEGKVSMAEIDRACRNVLVAKYKLGLFADPYRYLDAKRKGEIFSAENRQAARDYATRTAVLLKNQNQVLPLKKSGTIALIGPLADNHKNMLGPWSIAGDTDKTITILQGMQHVGGQHVTITYAKGANISDDEELVKNINAFKENEIAIDSRPPAVMLKEAVAAAEKADVVVVVVGESANMTGESSSMSNISLQQSQKDLIDALRKTHKPLVMVLMNGRPMTIADETGKVDALLDVWFPGTEGGNAVADLLFGDKIPSGKLTATFPMNVGQIPIYYSQKNTGRPYVKDGPTKYKSDYLDVSNDPLYEFGYGLSYTTFKYSPVTLSADKLGKNHPLTTTVTVTNTGNYDAEEVVQLYLRQMVGTITHPVKELKGFQKIFLKKGESKQVSFTINEETLKFYNEKLQFVSQPGAFKVFIGPSSATTNEASFTFE